MFVLIDEIERVHPGEVIDKISGFHKLGYYVSMEPISAESIIGAPIGRYKLKVFKWVQS